MLNGYCSLVGLKGIFGSGITFLEDRTKYLSKVAVWSFIERGICESGCSEGQRQEVLVKESYTTQHRLEVKRGGTMREW